MQHTTQNFGPDLSDILSDADLRDLARGDHYRLRGELSPEHQRLLSMVLPEMCGALLALRLGEAVAPIDTIDAAMNYKPFPPSAPRPAPPLKPTR